jgi:hypothetical protein
LLSFAKTGKIRTGSGFASTVLNWAVASKLMKSIIAKIYLKIYMLMIIFLFLDKNINNSDMIRQFFRENDIPYDQLEKLGLEKSAILDLDKDSLLRLLSGSRTNVLDLKGLDRDNNPFDFKAKISLYRDSEGAVNVMIHPVRKEIDNDINLKQSDIDRLKSGELVLKTFDRDKYLVQLDRETNELLRIPVREVIVPSYVKDVELSNDQKEKLRLGQPITVDSGNEKLQVAIDLTEPKGLKFSDSGFEQKLKEDFDRANPQIIGTVQTDENRSQYLEYQREHSSPRDNDFKIDIAPDKTIDSPKIKIQ